MAVNVDYVRYIPYNFECTKEEKVIKNIWAKTVLSAYRNLERITGAIDKLVETNAYNSFYMGGANFTNNNILSVAERLIELSGRKIRLINLKIMCDMAFENCKLSHSQILIEKYIDGNKAKEIAEKLNLTMRTYFRRLEGAEDEFAANLRMMGYNDEKIARELAGEKWISEIYNSFTNKT